MKNNFPFKTPIWAVVLLLSFLIFKNEVKNLLSNAVEFSVLGNTVKVSEKESEVLLTAQISFDDKWQRLMDNFNISIQPHPQSDLLPKPMLWPT